MGVPRPVSLIVRAIHRDLQGQYNIGRTTEAPEKALLSSLWLCVGAQEHRAVDDFLKGVGSEEAALHGRLIHDRLLQALEGNYPEDLAAATYPWATVPPPDSWAPSGPSRGDHRTPPPRSVAEARRRFRAGAWAGAIALIGWGVFAIRWAIRYPYDRGEAVVWAGVLFAFATGLFCFYVLFDRKHRKSSASVQQPQGSVTTGFIPGPWPSRPPPDDEHGEPPDVQHPG